MPQAVTFCNFSAKIYFNRFVCLSLIMTNEEVKRALGDVKSNSKQNYGCAFSLAFLSGSAIMAAELIPGKMLAPFYGNSTFTWTAIIGSTMVGLAFGYFLGGKLSNRGQPKVSITALLMIACIFFILMPFAFPFIMDGLIGLPVWAGAVTSCLLYILPLITCLGAISPLLIQLNVYNVEETGRYAGKVYGVATLGGVVITFALGFYFIPFFGLRMSSFIVAILLGIASLISYFNRRAE